MVAVVAGSIKFTMPDAGLEGRKPRPALFINSSHVVCHLTHGFNSAGVPNNRFGSVNDGSIDRAISEAAWRAKAEFRLDTSDKAEIAKFEFGFIQIMFDGQFLMQYAGAKPQLGSLAIAPDFQNTFYLDSNPAHTPWTLPPADREILIGDRIICFTGDHPAFLAKRRTENFHPSFGDSAAIDNHVQLISHSMHFITVLAQFEKKSLPGPGAGQLPLAAEVPIRGEVRQRHPGRPQRVQHQVRSAGEDWRSRVQRRREEDLRQPFGTVLQYSRARQVSRGTAERFDSPH